MSGPAQPIRPVSPATGQPLLPVASSDSAQLASVVAAARAAQRAWSMWTVDARAAGVRAFAARLSAPEASERLAQTICEEMGKPIRQARSEVRTVASRVESFVDRAREAVDSERTGSGRTVVEIQWRPLGVAAVIAPWNYPLSTPNNLVLSALLTGNAVVFKPSEYTPRTGALYYEMLAADLPVGVFGLVQGGGEVGAELVRAGVDVVAFTGSIAVGQAIMREAATRMTRLVLELGGKDPMLVFPGADLEAAARHAAEESMRNSGQVCISVERVLVHESIAAPFVDKVCARVRALRVGDPADEATEIGPMVSDRQRSIVLAQLEDARRRGATLAIEGTSTGPGFYLSPSVVTGVTDEMQLSCEETFGPVVAISTFSDADEAVRRANATRYGLGASVWGADGPELEAVAARIDAGMIGINRGLSAAGSAPWVGWKQSGYGYTRSTAGMRQFMQPRTITRDSPA